MTVKELKEFIKDVPDDTVVVIADPTYKSDDPYCGVELDSVDPVQLQADDVSVEQIRLWINKPNALIFGLHKLDTVWVKDTKEPPNMI
ncbi:MAG: hypothetical protein IJS58_05945 [Bacilli bacterium]|nr:hypothetical protein [Bacilli bacterium]